MDSWKIYTELLQPTSLTSTTISSVEQQHGLLFLKFILCDYMNNLMKNIL